MLARSLFRCRGATEEDVLEELEDARVEEPEDAQVYVARVEAPEAHRRPYPLLVHVLSTKLDALKLYDQFIANADGFPALQALWRDFKEQDLSDVARLKKLITEEIHKGAF